MHPLKVLLADDEQITREGMSQYVQWQQADLLLVSTAANGQEALAILKEQQIDILITDIKMPIMDGIQLIEQISALGINVLVIIVSAYNDFAYTQQAIRSQVVYDYILKPLEIAAFEQLLRSASTFWRSRMQDCGESPLFRSNKDRFAEEQFSRDSAVQNHIVKLIQDGHFAQAEETLRTAWNAEERSGNALDYFSRFAWEFTMKMSWMLTNSSEVPLSIFRLHNPMKALSKMQTKVEVADYCCTLIYETSEWQRGNKTLSVCIKACLDIVSEQYADANLSQASLAEKIMMSTNYLSTQFKREIGVGFTRYLTTYRIERSKELLCDAHYKTYEISERVGFTDARYYSKLFKEQVGVTPREYRKAYVVKELVGSE